VKQYTSRTTLADLAMIEKTRMQFQRHRIQMSNRMEAINEGKSNLTRAMCIMFFVRFRDLEDECSELIDNIIQGHPMWPWMKSVKGIGPGLSGSILAPIDIERAKTVSALWRYCGQGVDADGNRDRLVKGQKSNFNSDLKRTCYLVASSFLRASSPYRREYDEAKVYYEENRKEWTKGHIDMAARRKMIKLFLSHMWVVWRDLEGHDISSPYAFSVMKHRDFKPVWEYAPDYEYSPAVRACVPNHAGILVAA